MCLPFSKSEQNKKGRVPHSSHPHYDNPSCSHLEQPIPNRPNMKAAFLDEAAHSNTPPRHPPPPTPPKDSSNPATSNSHQTNKQRSSLSQQQQTNNNNQQQQQQQTTNATSPNNRDNSGSAPTLKSIGNYVLQQSLGKGSMGKVKLGVHNVTGEKVCFTYFFTSLLFLVIK